MATKTTKTETAELTKSKPVKFKRTKVRSTRFLREQLSIYINEAIREYRREERAIEKYATENPEWGAEYGNKSINYPSIMMKAIENISGPTTKELGWICKECGEASSSCDCKDEDDD